MIHIEIWSDVMCPFCYIGKRRLERALEQFEPRDRVTVEWKSFQLNPDVVTVPGKSVTEYLAETKGWTLEQARMANVRVTDMAREVGLRYDLDHAVVANSFDAHRLSHFAKQQGRQDALEELLFRAYFTEGKNTADHDTLTALAIAAGLDGHAARNVLAGREFAEDVERDISQAQQVGVRGVPFFVFNKSYAISGAQPVELFLQVLRTLLEEASTARSQQPGP